MKIEVTSDAQTRHTQNGDMHFQEAYLHKEGAKYPSRVQLSIESIQKAYAQGFYLLDVAKSTYIGQYDALNFSRFLTLIPVKQ